MVKMSTIQTKLSTMRFALNSLNCDIVMDEANFFPDCISDVIAAKHSGHVYEFEVKTSMEDLKADGRKKRHRVWKQIERYGKAGKAPNYFLYAVPFYMEREAVQFVRENYKYAGVLSCHPQNYSLNKQVLKPPILHKYPTSAIRSKDLIKKLSSRYIGAITRNVALACEVIRYRKTVRKAN